MALRSCLNKRKLDKDDLVFFVLGDLDEAVSSLGLVKVLAKEKGALERIQKDLMTISSLIAGCRTVSFRSSWLSREIKRLEKATKIPKEFVLPGEGELEARLHFSRAVVRRAERRLISLSKKEKVPKKLLNYLNHLSWFLFLLAVRR